MQCACWRFQYSQIKRIKQFERIGCVFVHKCIPCCCWLHISMAFVCALHIFSVFHCFRRCCFFVPSFILFSIVCAWYFFTLFPSFLFHHYHCNTIFNHHAPYHTITLCSLGALNCWWFPFFRAICNYDSVCNRVDFMSLPPSAIQCHAFFSHSAVVIPQYVREFL